ncbi:hypothetical protein [Ekhidna sp.]|uniref:hypothetical protein n=1 Tax=Ekhidna sp. TaxID=2608089 RepID=UPI003296EDA6
MKIILSYQPQLLSPPFAYATVMQIDSTANQLKVEFNLEYLGRDTISDDELHSEGFTRTDDFSWNGEISSNWKTDSESFHQFPFDDEPNSETYLHVGVDGKEYGFPRDIERAELIFQELMQAILEKAEREAPLHLECCINDQRHQLTWTFSERVIRYNDLISDNWDTGRKLLKTIYRLDFESLTPQKKPKKNGINLGDGTWYEIRERKVLEELDKLIIGLNS